MHAENILVILWAAASLTAALPLNTDSGVAAAQNAVDDLLRRDIDSAGAVDALSLGHSSKRHDPRDLNGSGGNGSGGNAMGHAGGDKPHHPAARRNKNAGAANAGGHWGKGGSK